MPALQIKKHRLTYTSHLYTQKM